jgi:hypothetical protein
MEQTDSTLRRGSARRPVRMACEAVRERDFSRIGRVAVDLSRDGMQVRSDARVLTGDAVIVSFFEPTSGRWFDLEAQVARVVHGRRTEDAGRGVGLKFVSMREDDRAALDRALRGRVPSLPKPRKRP